MATKMARSFAVLLLMVAWKSSEGVETIPWSSLRQGASPQVTVDLSRRHPVTKTLFGIFFEEIGHAGDGGLYAELVQDRSFDAIAAATGFLAGSANGRGRLPVDLDLLAATQRRATHPIVYPWQASNATYRTKQERIQRNRLAANPAPRDGIIIAWHALPGTLTALSKTRPLNEGNVVAMELTAAGGPDGGGRGGLVNDGYWGISLAKGERYTLTVFLRNPQAGALPVTVSLASADLRESYAECTFKAAGGGDWARYTAQLKSAGDDADARLVITFPAPATLIVDSVSIFPGANVDKGRALGHTNPWPFRPDLLAMLKELRPAFVRLPGGCYVEGDWMRNAFRWKPALGPNERRPGHMNGVWGYWSTDGLGLFEYMLLAEELQAEPVWVVNNGVAHGDSVPASAAMELVHDALDSIEFVTGPANSTWGGVRAAMGHPEPWALNYVAIGNEDCGKPWYVENYNLFYGAISAAYPHIRLVANCDMGDAAPTDLWDWHVYTSPQQLFNQRTQFDGRDPGAGRHVFASEYAVTDGGGWGNLIGAVAEAAFMTGLERNSEAVELAAYAPLFVHWNDRPWPTNMIVFDNRRAFGIPSYHVQCIFRETQGTQYAATEVVDPPPGSEVHAQTVAASATCQDDACSALVVKVVNFASFEQTAAVRVVSGGGGVEVEDRGQAIVLTGEHPEDENSFEQPLKVAPTVGPLSGLSDAFALRLPPYSLTALQLRLGAPPSASAAATA